MAHLHGKDPGVGFAGSGFYVEAGEGQSSMESAIPLPGEKQTNNRAELFALIMAARKLPQEWSLAFYCDSMYVVHGVKQRLPQTGQASNTGQRLVGREAAYADLWELVISALSARQQQWAIFWLRGHVGIEGNEKADRLANRARVENPLRLSWLRRQPMPSTWFEWEP